MSTQFVKLHSLLAEKGDQSQKRSSGEHNQPESTTTVGTIRNRSEYTARNTSQLLRLTGASIESTLWISWRHLEQYCTYGNVIEKSNGFSGKTNFELLEKIMSLYIY